MRFSDAMMLGLTISPKLVPYVRADGFGGHCALGLAEIATGAKHQKFSTVDWNNSGEPAEKKWPWLYRTTPSPCECHTFRNRQPTAITTIVHLFNEHIMRGQEKSPFTGSVWTMEQLYDWLRTVEPSDAADTTAQPATQVAATETVTTPV